MADDEYLRVKMAQAAVQMMIINDLLPTSTTVFRLRLPLADFIGFRRLFMIKIKCHRGAMRRLAEIFRQTPDSIQFTDPAIDENFALDAN